MTNNESRKENDYWDIGLMKLLKGMNATDILGIRAKSFHDRIVGGHE
jgi:hypothetical protein